MQHTLKFRETLTGPTTIYTEPLDVSGTPLLTVDLTTHVFTGSSLLLQGMVETSDDLETWAEVGSDVNVTTVTLAKVARLAASDVYLRYVRVRLVLSGTDPVVNYSLFVNTFDSR